MINNEKNQYTKIEFKNNYEKFIGCLPLVSVLILIIPHLIMVWSPIVDKENFDTRYWWGGFTLFWFIYLIIWNIYFDAKKVYPYGHLKRFLVACFMMGFIIFWSVLGFQFVWLIGSLSMAEPKNMSAQVLDANIKETSKSWDRKWVLKLSNGQTVRVRQPRNHSFKIGDTVSVTVRENQWGIWVESNSSFSGSLKG